MVSCHAQAQIQDKLNFSWTKWKPIHTLQYKLSQQSLLSPWNNHNMIVAATCKCILNLLINIDVILLHEMQPKAYSSVKH